MDTVCDVIMCRGEHLTTMLIRMCTDLIRQHAKHLVTSFTRELSSGNSPLTVASKHSCLESLYLEFVSTVASKTKNRYSLTLNHQYSVKKDDHNIKYQPYVLEKPSK